MAWFRKNEKYGGGGGNFDVFEVTHFDYRELIPIGKNTLTERKDAILEKTNDTHFFIQLFDKDGVRYRYIYLGKYVDYLETTPGEGSSSYTPLKKLQFVDNYVYRYVSSSHDQFDYTTFKLDSAVEEYPGFASGNDKTDNESKNHNKFSKFSQLFAGKLVTTPPTIGNFIVSKASSYQTPYEVISENGSHSVMVSNTQDQVGIEFNLLEDLFQSEVDRQKAAKEEKATKDKAESEYREKNPNKAAIRKAANAAANIVRHTFGMDPKPLRYPTPKGGKRTRRHKPKKMTKRKRAKRSSRRNR